jgi:hypothetical protein
MRAWRCAVPIALPIALAVGALVAGCTTTVTGSAEAGSPVAAGNQTTPPPVPTTPPARTTLDCSAGSGGKVIQPKGAPYCYLLPGGFSDATGQLTLNYQSDNPSQYDSAVAVAVHDVIIVAVYPLRENSDNLSASSLSDQVDAVLGQGESAGFTVTGDPTQTTVDDARAFEIPIKQNDGQYVSSIYFVFRGFTEVEINCQFADHKADIDKGCASMRASIEIIDPPR